MKKRTLLERIISFVLALIIAIPAGISNMPVKVSAEEEDVEPITISLDWVDSQFKDGTAFNLNEEDNVTNLVKMQVSYESRCVREEGYAPGELIITVKGIGNVSRKKPIEAIVGADKEGSGTKTRDWSYTWNKANDTYTLTNNEEIKGNSVFSGYFELVWEVKARDSIHGYTQNGLQSVLYLPGGSSVSSNTLSFSNHTKVDTFEVYIEEHPMYSYEGLTENIKNPEDYAFIRYNLGAEEYENSRGLKNSYYLFDPDTKDLGSGAIVISPKLSCSNNGEGKYIVSLEYLSPKVALEDQYIFVAYPKAQYADKNVYASLTKYGAFLEGDDAGNKDIKELATSQIGVPVPNNFTFTDIPGVIYQYYKYSYYDKFVHPDTTLAQGGDISGSKMLKGTTQTFYLEGPLNNPKGTSYTLEMVDDFLYILKNNGDYRQLEADEYKFKSVTIPGTSNLKNLNDVSIAADTYKAVVYAAQDGKKIDTATQDPHWIGLIRVGEQTVSLPDGTTSISVILVDIQESIKEFSIPVNVTFHINDTSELPWEEQDNLTSGQVVNTTFIRLYTKQNDGNYMWSNDDFGKENYLDDTNLKLAEKDLALYGSYLDREKSNITFFPGSKDNYFAYTYISDIVASGSKFLSTVKIGANFAFGEDSPNQFSLYTILPEPLTLSGYKNEEDIWDIMDLSGLGMKESALSAACTPEIIENYKDTGRTYIALHFDFGDKEVPVDGNIRATLQTRVNASYLKKSSTIPLRSCVIIDKEINEHTIGKKNDDGSWDSTTQAAADIDRDGNTEETLADSLSSIYYVFADSSQMQLTKYVQTTYSDGWVQEPDVPSEEYGGAYQYSLYLKNGKSKAKNIIVKDILETGEKMQWQGTFQSIDLSECEAVGLSGTVYYSSKTAPSDNLKSSDWTTQKPGVVKAIAVDFGDSVLKEGKELNVIVNMKAPTDTSLKNKITDNGFSAAFTMLDSATGNVTGTANLASNFVQVRLTPPLKTVLITKEDAESSGSLAGAKFVLVEKTTGETIAEAISNERGYATFRNIPADTTYILRETEAPVGYETVEDREIVMNGQAVRLTVKDPRKTGRIEVYKVSNLGHDIPVAGAEYTLYNEEGAAVSTAITDVNGLAVFEKLAWGSYTVKETASPAGYQLNETVYPVKITRENVADTAFIDTTDIQDDVSVRLNKYAKKADGTITDIPVAGATFELVRKTAAGDKRVGLYVTDSEGRVDLIELPYGDYYFREYRTPEGYIAVENVEFSLTPEKKEVTLTAYNQRKAGRIIITKKDSLGNLVQDVEFSIYNKKDAAATPLAKVLTDEYGVATFENLEWGTYYILETKAPDYYHMDTEWKDVLINGGHLIETLEVINETKKGSVILTKTDDYTTEAMAVYLAGAEYTLYKDDGTVIGNYVTADKETTLADGTVLKKGQLIAQNLEWGSYYFKETKAPEGYSLSDETVRFSVNAINAHIVQEIDVTDPLDSKSITLIKRIKASDVNFDNGNPTFIFKVAGKDVNCVDHTYFRSVTFDKAYVNANTGSDGYVTATAIISDLTAGKYTATEQESSRYYLQSITNPVNGTVNGKQIVFDLSTDDKDDASAVFTNRNYEQQDFSDTQILMNVLKRKAKLTALKVSYGAEAAEAESSVKHELLDVTAYYDDGTTKVLSEGDYTLSPEKFPNENGSYTMTVTREENGVKKSDTFTVKLYGMKERIIKLDASLKDGAKIDIGTKISGDQFDVTAVYNTGKKQVLNGITGLAPVPGAQAATLTSTNWPDMYPIGAEMVQEKTFAGADGVQITFDPASEVEQGWDYIYVYDSTGTKVYTFTGKECAGKTYTVNGDYVKIVLDSDEMINAAGYSASVVPLQTVSAEYTISPATAPNNAGQFEVTFDLNLDKIPNGGHEVQTTISVTAEYPDPLLMKGTAFKEAFQTFAPDATAVVFTDAKAPAGVDKVDLSLLGNGSVIGWVDGETFYVSSQRGGIKVIANEDCQKMFYNTSNDLTKIDMAMLDGSKINNSYRMFYYCPDLTDLTLPDGLQKIGQEMLSQTQSLETVEIPNSVKAIERTAFYGSGITSIVIPDSVETIGENAFDSCNDLADVTIGSGVKTIEGYTFASCYDLKNITIPNGVETIKKSAFSNCSNLLTIDIPASVTTIEAEAFYGTVGLTSITVDAKNANYCSEDGVLFNKDKTILMQYPAADPATTYEIPSTVRTIGKCAFYRSDNLTTMDIPDTVTKIDEGGFQWCRGLTEVIIGTGVTSLGKQAFYRNEVLVSVTIESDLTYIAEQTFRDCEKLKNINIPSTVKSIENSAFNNCKALTTINIPNGVESIGDSAFYSCNALKSITIPDSVTTLKDCAFESCRTLTSVTLSKNITSIGERVFNRCNKLTNVQIPDGVETICERAFSDCSSLTYVIIPASVKTIESYAFNGCSALATVYYKGTEAQWGGITIEANNTPLTDATLTCNYTG